MDEVRVASPDSTKGARKPVGRALLMLAIATTIAATCAAAVFGFVFYADFLTGTAGSVVHVMFEHSALLIIAAASPIFGVLLVGYGYMSRGLRRRALEKAAAAAAARPVSVPVRGAGSR